MHLYYIYFVSVCGVRQVHYKVCIQLYMQVNTQARTAQLLKKNSNRGIGLFLSDIKI